MTLSLEQLLSKIEEIQNDPERFTIYEDNPVGFCEDVLGVQLWARQKDVLQAMVKSRRIAVRSGHSVGKTFVVACGCIWWLYARKGLVVSTAPTREQLETVLWREIRDRVQKAPVNLPRQGSYLTELRVTPEWNAIGLTTDHESAFHGHHHPRLLVLVDEAPGVSEQIHLEISTLATGDENCIMMIGNPTTTSGTFYKAFKMPDYWKCLKISCLDHPNVVEGREIIPGAVTRGWIDERRKAWGENHPFWYSRVLGEFPQISTKGVIPLGWCERAQNEEQRLRALDEAEKARIPRVGGLDVARYGDNETVLTIRRGDAIEEQIAWHHKTLTETTGMAVNFIKQFELKTLVIDANGIGAGVYDRLMELRQPVLGYNGGHRAFTPSSFSNRRSEMWWSLRARLERQRLWLPPNSERLIGELVTPEYEVVSSGRIKVQSKEDLIREGRSSPDYADSLILCYAMEEDPEAELLTTRSEGRDPWIAVEEQGETLEQFGAGY
jgi:hypothetical protein